METSKGGEERPPAQGQPSLRQSAPSLLSPSYLHIRDAFILQAPHGARRQKGPQLPVLQGDHVHQPQDFSEEGEVEDGGVSGGGG